MAITTLDQALAGMQYPREVIKAATPTLVVGRPHSLFYLAGIPGAAAAPTPGVSGVALTTYAGQIPFTNPASGNSYIGRFAGQATIAGQLLLCDRLWHNSGLSVTATSAQVVNSAGFPARDADGATLGNAIIIGVEVTAAEGAGAPNLSMNYTNSLGASGRVGDGVLAVVASSAIGAFYPIGLAAGDVGVRSIQTYTRSATSTSGSESLVAYRILARMELTTANVPNALDCLTSGFARLFNNSVPFLLFIPSAVTASTIAGHVIWTQG